MKRAACVLVAVAAVSAAHDASALPPGDVVLYHPGVTATDPHVRTLVGPDKLSPAESKRIKDALFGARYLGDAAQCRDAAITDLAAARAAGDFVPDVFQVASGSFTAAGRTQNLYLVANGECGAPHASSFGSITLAVFEGRAVVARALIDGGAALQHVVDVDRDGQSEVVLTSGYANMGITVASVKLVRMETGGLALVHDFGRVYEADCSDPDGPGRETYSIVHAVTAEGGSVRYRLERHTGVCEP